MSENDLVSAGQPLVVKRKPCICCGSDFGGLLVMRESEELKEARLELEAAIESHHDLQVLIGKVAKLKAVDDVWIRQRMMVERKRLTEALGNVPVFQAASPSDLRIV
jgi:hypothetical protein